MNLFLMLVVYVLVGGQPKMESKVFPMKQGCEEAVQTRTLELLLDEKVLGIVVAGCGQVPGQEVKKETRKF